jgi:hypothetical protein
MIGFGVARKLFPPGPFLGAETALPCVEFGHRGCGGAGRAARPAHSGRHCGTRLAVRGLERPLCCTASAATPSASRLYLPTRGRVPLGGGVESRRA